MKRATLNFYKGYIVFENFNELQPDQLITINILRDNKRVTINKNIMSSESINHYCVKLEDYKVYNPDLILKLQEAGIEDGEEFQLILETYMPVDLVSEI